MYAFPCARASKSSQQICLSPEPGRSSNQNTWVLKLTPVQSRWVVSCPLQPRTCHWNCVFLHNFSGMKRACWKTGSWRCYLSLEVVSSITILCRFLCGFIRVLPCQSIKIKPTNMPVGFRACVYVPVRVCVCVCIYAFLWGAFSWLHLLTALILGNCESIWLARWQSIKLTLGTQA